MGLLLGYWVGLLFGAAVSTIWFWVNPLRLFMLCCCGEIQSNFSFGVWAGVPIGGGGRAVNAARLSAIPVVLLLVAIVAVPLLIVTAKGAGSGIVFITGAASITVLCLSSSGPFLRPRLTHQVARKSEVTSTPSLSCWIRTCVSEFGSVVVFMAWLSLVFIH